MIRYEKSSSCSDSVMEPGTTCDGTCDTFPAAPQLLGRIGMLRTVDTPQSKISACAHAHAQTHVTYYACANAHTANTHVR